MILTQKRDIIPPLIQDCAVSGLERDRQRPHTYTEAHNTSGKVRVIKEKNDCAIKKKQ